MIFTVLFLVLFFLTAGILTLFVFSVLIPSAKQQEDNENMQSYLLAPDEMKSQEKPRRQLRDTGLRAVVKCRPDKEFDGRRIEYNGLRDCRLFNELYQSEFDCLYQCIGFGSCVSCCPQQAIRIENGTAVVLAGCIGCGRCLEVCPKNVIELVPIENVDRTIRCCSSDGDTSCSSYKKTEKIEIPNRRILKCWRICYNIFYKNDR